MVDFCQEIADIEEEGRQEERFNVIQGMILDQEPWEVIERTALRSGIAQEKLYELRDSLMV